MKGNDTEITAAWVADRTERLECGCLVWTGYHQLGEPKVNVRRKGRRTPTNARRVIYEAVHGVRLTLRTVVRCNCDTPLCVEPACLEAVRAGSWNRGRKHSLEYRQRWQRQHAAEVKVPDEHLPVVREMLDCEVPQVDIAALFGVTQSWVSMFNLGKTRADLRNPFVALLLR